MTDQKLSEIVVAKHILIYEIIDETQLRLGVQKLIGSIIPEDSSRGLKSLWGLKIIVPKEVIKIEGNTASISFRSGSIIKLETTIMNLLKQLFYLQKTRIYQYNRQEFYSYLDKLISKIKYEAYKHADVVFN